MEKIVSKVYDIFNTNRKQFEAQLADAEDIKALEELEKTIIQNGKE